MSIEQLLKDPLIVFLRKLLQRVINFIVIILDWRKRYSKRTKMSETPDSTQMVDMDKARVDKENAQITAK